MNYAADEIGISVLRFPTRLRYDQPRYRFFRRSEITCSNAPAATYAVPRSSLILSRIVLAG
jgi:hypothetical protein